MENKEGWTWLFNTPKWHYFVGGRSLCKKWSLLFGTPQLEQGNNNSPDNCKICIKKLMKRLQENYNESSITE